MQKYKVVAVDHPVFAFSLLCGDLYAEDNRPGGLILFIRLTRKDELFMTSLLRMDNYYFFVCFCSCVTENAAVGVTEQTENPEITHTLVIEEPDLVSSAVIEKKYVTFFFFHFRKHFKVILHSFSAPPPITGFCISDTSVRLHNRASIKCSKNLKPFQPQYCICLFSTQIQRLQMQLWLKSL